MNLKIIMQREKYQKTLYDSIHIKLQTMQTNLLLKKANRWIPIGLERTRRDYKRAQGKLWLCSI